MRPVPALRRELTIAEHVSHQLGQKLADLLDAEPFLPRSKGQGVPCQRRRHDREGIFGIPPKRAGSVSMGRILWNSTIEPGQPCDSSSGIGFGPLPSS